jgi:hypothetical protein
MRTLSLLLSSTLVLSLACGGTNPSSVPNGADVHSATVEVAPAPTPSGPVVGEHAQRLADWYAKEDGVACSAVPVGGELTVGDFTVRVRSVEGVHAEATLPKIRNLDERAIFGRRGVRGLAVVFEVRNNAPVERGLDWYWTLHARDGRTLSVGEYNTRLYKAAKSSSELFVRALPPGEWLAGASVAAVTGEQDAGVVLRVWRTTSVLDERGRRHVIVAEQGLLELPSPGGAAAPTSR